MQAALGLALVFGGSVLALYLLTGHLPFEAAGNAASGGGGAGGGFTAQQQTSSATSSRGGGFAG